MRPIMTCIAGLALGLTLGGSTGTASVEPRIAAAGPATSDLDGLLWPAGAAGRRIDQGGATLSPDDLRDRIVVVSFVAPDCAIVCVARTLDLERAARSLPDGLRDRAVFLAVSFDASPTRLRAFVDGTVGAGTRLRFLTGPPAWSDALAAMLRYPAASLPEPPPQILLFDRRGAVASNYGGDPVDGPRLASDIAVLDTFAQGLDAAR
ncbi:SCO family protein [Methylobacterium indicum]|uniref:SCO family protein n=1 Tax=Methylobacterium indicum TaxID=1775910 RepID=UPI00069FDF31|nr:hypothetical protein [Methylobacterium indicum]